MRQSGGTDEGLLELLDKAETLLKGVPAPRQMKDGPTLTTRLHIGEQRVETITTIAAFSGANDVLLHDLRVELVSPADERSARFFESAAESPPAPAVPE